MTPEENRARIFKDKLKSLKNQLKPLLDGTIQLGDGKKWSKKGSETERAIKRLKDTIADVERLLAEEWEE